MPRLIRSGDLKPAPWKNGGGVTSEIAIFPTDATVETFNWRVSLAQVASSGPFSRFPGIDRTLSVLAGHGLRLEVDGYSAITLDTTSPPFAFPGNVATTASLLDGPIVDFNVMTRRGRFTHVVERVMLARGESARGLSPQSSPSMGRSPTTLLFCARGSVVILVPPAGIVLCHHDVLVDDERAPFEIEACEPSLILRVTIVPGS